MQRGVKWTLILLCILLTGCLGVSGTPYSVTGKVEVQGGGRLPQDIVAVFKPGGSVAVNEEGSFAMTGLKGKVTVTLELPEGWGCKPESIMIDEAKSGQSLDFTVYDQSKYQGGSVKVSFIADYGSVKAAVNSRPKHAFTPEIYREELQDPGEKVGSFTPSKFLVNIQELRIVHPDYSERLLFPPEIAADSQGGSPILVHFDLARSERVIDASYVLSKERFNFSAVQMLCFTKDRSGSGWYDLPPLSEIHVDLGEKYQGVVLRNEEPDKAYGTVHVFELAGLIPLENNRDTEVMQLIFGDYVQDPFILNPDGSYLHFLDDHPWETGGNHGLGGYAIYLPGFELEFQEVVHNHLVFSWNLADLIEVYDNGTEDPADDLVTFCLADPFPISLHLESLTEVPEIEIEERSAGEVEHLDIRYYDLIHREVVLRWINPSDDQYKTTHIVRKLGSEPLDINDGELVFSGSDIPIFQDIGVEQDQKYFYRVFTESKAGLFSEGIVRGVETHVPQPSKIELYAVKNGHGVIEGDVVEMEPGEWIRVYVRTDTHPHRVVLNWSIDGDSVSLGDHIGEGVNVLADAPGEAVLWGRHKGGAEDFIKIRVTE